MKLILIISIGMLMSFQLFAQKANVDSVAFDQLTESEQEIRIGGTIQFYEYKGRPFTGIAVEKKFLGYILYEIKAGKKHGNVTHYSKNNRKKEAWEYKKGILRAKRKWYLDGDLEYEITFTRKSRFKEEQIYRKNGELKESIKARLFSSSQKVKRYSLKGIIAEKGCETHIEKGKKVERIKVGKWIYYNHKGKRKKVEYYDQDGKLVSSTKM